MRGGIRWAHSVLCLLVSALLALTLSAVPGIADPGDEDPPRPAGEECIGVPPPPVDAGQATRTDPLLLRVLVLADGISVFRASEITSRAEAAFRGSDIRVEWRVAEVDFPGAEAEDLLDLSRDFVGGTPPAGFDLVHLITSVNVLDDGVDSLSGRADCLGGIRYPEYAFSVSEDDPAVERREVLGVREYPNYSAVVVAHEVAHLLGAHHYHGNCAEGASAGDPDFASCTVMEAAVQWRSLRFGLLERATIRSVLEEYSRAQ